MRKINLLPEEYSPNRKVLGISNRLKRISTIGYILFFIVTAASIGGLFFLSHTASDLKKTKETLSQELNNLSKTETKIVLLKNRAVAAKSIFDQDSVNPSLKGVSKIYDQLPAGININKVEVADKDVSFDIIAPDSSTITNFIEYLLANETFKNITLNNLNYSESRGYSASFLISI
jgi:hypothetical protein